MDEQTEVQGQPYVSEMVDHVYPSRVSLESDYFVEFSEFLEKYSSFKTLTQQCISNTEHIPSIFNHWNNLIFFLLHTHFFKKIY